jgi:hypothetical protein
VVDDAISLTDARPLTAADEKTIAGLVRKAAG